jgi:subtilisin-like proprotein convertase family protein
MVFAFFAFSACAPDNGFDGSGQIQEKPANTMQTVQQGEAWNSINNPSLFKVQLEYKLSALPKEGRAEKIPWPDTYWPTYEDSINARWQVGYGQPASKDTLSPAEKYDMAFNNWNPGTDFYKLKPYSSSNCDNKSWDKEYYNKLGPAAKYVSENKGNWEAHDGYDSDGDGKTDECDDRDGVETWWGLCHAWVPAAILEKEPQKPVVHNGVKFEVSDIKALLIAMYDSSDAILVGGRCNDKEVKVDSKTGRILADQCRDTNPGTYHVVMANFLGKKKALAEDRTYDYQVWNQPIVEWKVNSMKEIKEKDAIKLLGLPATVTKYPHNKNAKKWYEVYATTYYITESEASTEAFTDVIDDYTRDDQYHYILEIDKNGKVIGGEWLDQSHKNHPDFLWLPIAPGGGNPYIDMDNVMMLMNKSVNPDIPVGDIKEYENKSPLDIPDNNSTGVTSKINVPDNFTIGAKIDVDVDITHTYIGDLIVTLKKGEKSVILHNKAGGSAKNLKKTFTVTDWTGLSAKGEWSLVIADVASSDTGKLNSWKLKIVKTGGTTPTGDTIKASSTDTPKNIPDNNTAGVTSTINVTDSKTIKAVKVIVKIEHTYIGALIVKVKHAGKEKILHNLEGGEGTSIDKSYDVAEFNGMSSSGSWELNAADTDAYGDTGKIVSWSLEITY